ncbi:MAG: bifunctional phosphoglucose/phosphomannose isomerase [Candidatus Thorarchaeota archaeon]
MSNLDGIDLKSMRNVIEAFPILLDAIHIDSKVLEKVAKIRTTGFKGIALLGMGGSAIAGTMCKEILQEKNPVPIISIRDDTLPGFVDNSWIIIAVSYSGNTEETLSAFQDSKQRDCQIFTITSGGQLENLADEGYLCKLPKGFQPRAALPLLISLEFYLLEMLLDITPSDMKSIREYLLSIANNWEEATISPSNVVEQLQDKVPLFIGWQHTAPVAYRAKCQVNENSKSLAFFSVMPEVCHNEIESSGEFDRSQIVPIFLRSTFETPEATRRFEGIFKIYKDEGCMPLQLQIKSRSKIEEVLTLTYFCDIVSLEIAERKEVDPVSIERIAKLKRFLSKT